MGSKTENRSAQEFSKHMKIFSFMIIKEDNLGLGVSKKKTVAPISGLNVNYLLADCDGIDW